MTNLEAIVRKLGWGVTILFLAAAAIPATRPLLGQSSAPASGSANSSGAAAPAAPAQQSADKRSKKTSAKQAAADATSTAPSAAYADKPDYDAIFKIKEEGFSRSQVMEIESYLTDVYGPRLTGSPNIKEAGEWAQKTMRGWGLANVHVETWPFGRGWQNHRFVAQAVTPRAYPLTGFPKAWTPGTNGPVTGDAVFADIRT